MKIELSEKEMKNMIELINNSKSKSLIKIFNGMFSKTKHSKLFDIDHVIYTNDEVLYRASISESNFIELLKILNKYSEDIGDNIEFVKDSAMNSHIGILDTPSLIKKAKNIKSNMAKVKREIESFINKL